MTSRDDKYDALTAQLRETAMFLQSVASAGGPLSGNAMEQARRCLVEADLARSHVAHKSIEQHNVDMRTKTWDAKAAVARGEMSRAEAAESLASVPSTTRRSDCPLENCEKTGQCEFPQDCDAPSPATPRSGETPITDAAGLWLMAEGPLPADWKCPPGQEADIRRFDHELLGPCTEWKVVTAAIARRLERGAFTLSATPCSQWTALAERRPEGFADVLAVRISTGRVVVESAIRIRHLWADAQANSEECAYTHWQEMPDAPNNSPDGGKA